MLLSPLASCCAGVASQPKSGLGTTSRPPRQRTSSASTSTRTTPTRVKLAAGPTLPISPSIGQHPAGSGPGRPCPSIQAREPCVTPGRVRRVLARLQRCVLTTRSGNLRPLIVFIGQGLSLADRFDLVALVQGKVPDAFEVVPASERRDLDLVVEELLRLDRDPTPTNRLGRLLTAIRDLGPQSAAMVATMLPTTDRLCRTLAEEARRRTVVLASTNVDRGARFAAVPRGAQWLLGRDLIGTATRAGVVRWYDDIRLSHPGFHYIALHGEPGIGSTGDGGLFFASLPEFTSWRPARQPWYEPLMEGLGGRTREVDDRLSFAKEGYTLVERMLVAGAQFVVVGYGAGGSDRRERYAFERRITTAFETLDRAPDNWIAIGRWTDDRSTKWFDDRGFRRLDVTPGISCGDLLDEVISHRVERGR